MTNDQDIIRGSKQIISGSIITTLATILLLSSLAFGIGILEYISAGMLTLSSGSLLGGLYNTRKGLKNSE